jgi:hypothetical protein
LHLRSGLQALSLGTVCGFSTTARRIGSAVTQPGKGRNFIQSVPGTVRETEVDNRADTTVFGANMKVISFTGQVCDVQAFKESMPTEKDVPIATAATAYDDPDTGETILLKFNQGLWFGTSMKHSLANPNQCRMNGIDLCDDPLDKHRSLRIKDDGTGLTVPLKFSRCVVGVTTRAPSHEEIEEARNARRTMTMTSEATWDPSTVSISLLGNSISNKSDFSHTANSEWDMLLQSCSAIYTEKSMLDRMVAKYVHNHQT